MKRLRSTLALTAAALLAVRAPSAAQTHRASAPPAATKPMLVVFITVDQMRPDYFTRWTSQLTGGLGRLYRGGAVFTNGFQDHAVTETAPGHASTLSGRFPASTGIVMNNAGVLDSAAPLIGGHGLPASPRRFRGTTLIDWMRSADARSRALSVSRKDRAAILPLGRAKQSVFWYAFDGRFTTSTYYADTLPAWVRRFNARRIPQSWAGKQWTTLLPASAYAEPDTVQVESGAPIMGGRHEPAFPHQIPSNPDSAAKYFPEFPMMDQATLDLALRGLREMRLGRGPQTDLLAVSLSTTDAVGHRFGPDSREIHDQILRLDRMLGVFLDSVYAGRDASRVIVALTADHGATSFPEVANPAEAASWHVVSEPVVRRAQAGLAARGLDTAAFSLQDGMLFVDHAAFSRAGVNADSAVDALAGEVRALTGVQRVDRLADLRRAANDADTIGRRWVHMIPRDVPVDLVVTLLPGRVWGRRLYAQHGSPHDDDAHVPILFYGSAFRFYGSAFRPGRHDGFVRVADIAPTLARAIGVAPTEPLDGHVLEDAFR
ncbi:MAG TPA: alkaline phosphatase family protein [Longimicrobiaceae bacterium]|jgi:arylsulfatase A-like enzyme|nr:alkaline phosphatase family protein [Longimicrobiaceae bacterium]